MKILLKTDMGIEHTAASWIRELGLSCTITIHEATTALAAWPIQPHGVLKEIHLGRAMDYLTFGGG